MRDDQSVPGKGARNPDQLRLRDNRYTEYAAFGRNPPASPTGHTEMPVSSVSSEEAPGSCGVL